MKIDASRSSCHCLRWNAAQQRSRSTNLIRDFHKRKIFGNDKPWSNEHAIWNRSSGTWAPAVIEIALCPNLIRNKWDCEPKSGDWCLSRETLNDLNTLWRCFKVLRCCDEFWRPTCCLKSSAARGTCEAFNDQISLFFSFLVISFHVFLTLIDFLLHLSFNYQRCIENGAATSSTSFSKQSECLNESGATFWACELLEASRATITQKLSCHKVQCRKSRN